MWAGPRSPSDLRVYIRAAQPDCSWPGAGSFPAQLSSGLQREPKPTETLGRLWVPLGREGGPPQGRKGSCLAPRSVAPHPKAGPPRPLLHYSSFPLLHPLSLGFQDVLRAPPLLPFPLAISNPRPSAWQLFRAGLHSPLQWSLGRDPQGFPNPPSLTPGSPIGAGDLVTSSPAAALASLGALTRPGSWSVRPDSDRQRPEAGVRELV